MREGERELIAVDTAVWLQGLVFGGAAEELFKLAVTGRVEIVSSELLLVELGEVLRRGLRFSDAAVAQVERFVRECATVVPDASAPAAAAGVPRSLVLQAARRAGATCIATTERSPLLGLDPWEGIPIVSIA